MYDGFIDNNIMDTATALLPEMIALHVLFINECTSESVADHVSNNDNGSIWDEDKHEGAVSPDTNDGIIHGSNCLEQFMELIICNRLDVISNLALSLIQLLELGKCHLGPLTVRANICHAINGGSRPRRGGGDSNATVEGED